MGNQVEGNRVVFCKTCKNVFSTDNYPAEQCPNCQIEVMETGLSYDAWKGKTEEEKSRLINEWQTLNADSSTSVIEMYLRQIAEATRKIARWVVFWSIITIIGVIVFILFLMSQPR